MKSNEKSFTPAATPAAVGYHDLSRADKAPVEKAVRSGYSRRDVLKRMASNLHGPNDRLDPTLFTATIDYTHGRARYNH